MKIQIDPHQVAALIVQDMWKSYADTNNAPALIQPEQKRFLQNQIVKLMLDEKEE